MNTRRSADKPTTVDRFVAAKMLRQRNKLGLTREQVAQEIGVTHQQVREYEMAQDCIGAGRLYDIAQALDVPVSYFFKGLHP